MPRVHSTSLHSSLGSGPVADPTVVGPSGRPAERPLSKKDARRARKNTGNSRRTLRCDNSSTPELSDSEAEDTQHLILDDLDDPIQWVFKSGDPVWVKELNNVWTHGTVSGPNTRVKSTRSTKLGIFYPISVARVSRRYLSPSNGDVKPDIPQVRRLLLEGGWL
ncbi:hypothetical protein B0H21DRAFT_114018 [Amylocystis lapponica]|nr:hypothetical protein B0H21DRAFT_114018 [Amylocystis lapponica]